MSTSDSRLFASRAVASRLKSTYTGFATGHAGELIQANLSGNVVVSSLPVSELNTIAVFEPSKGEPFRVYPEDNIKAQTTGELLLSQLGLYSVGGTVTLTPSPGFISGKGLGRSTADCLSTARAILKFAGAFMPAEQVAKLLVRSEGASDGTVFSPELVLFESRIGNLIRRFGVVPAMNLVAVDTMPATTVDTLSTALPEYDEDESLTIPVLESTLTKAIREGDLEGVGRVATESAKINQRYLPKPRFDQILEIASVTKAVGVSASHTGTFLFLLYSPATWSDLSVREECYRRISNLNMHSCELTTVTYGGSYEDYSTHSSRPNAYEERHARSRTAAGQSLPSHF